MKKMLTWVVASLLATVMGMSAAVADTITYVYTDQTGSPLVLTDAAGTVVRQYRYQPFGEEQIIKSGGSMPMNIGFAGKRLDTATDLQYSLARYYDRKNGRFVSLDPVGPAEGDPHLFNRYAYANNNPYMYVDPDGRNPILVARGGWVIGTGISYAFEAIVGVSIGVKVWEVLHNETADTTQNPSGTNTEDKPSLLDPQGDKHILDGDGQNKGGGHRSGTGKPGKSEFPSNWTDDRIRGEISDVATDPNSVRTPQQGGRIKIQGTRDGIDITVIVEPGSKGGRIVTGFPTNTPRNP